MSDDVKQGVCIVSFDSGGPGTISQLLFLKELMNRLEYDLDIEENTLFPADYFDMFGGVGWGIVAGVLLGLLRMNPDEAMDELSRIAHAVFPNEPNVLATPEANMSKLRAAVEDMLIRRQVLVDIKLNDKSFSNSRCKVVLFVPTTETMGHCHPFRSYRSRERGAPNCSVVDAICAALANPETFIPVTIGPPMRRQLFAGTPLGFSNPIRAVLEEARIAFGNDTKVALILSLGSGQSSSFSLRSSLFSNASGDFMSLLPRLVEDCERVAKEMARQLADVEAYLRLSVDKGLGDLKTSDWHRLGTVVSHTDAYIQSPPIPNNFNKALELLQSRSGSLTLGELGQANAMVAAKAQYRRQDCDLSLQIQDIARKVDRIVIEKITFIDSVGNRVPIPMELCCSYEMLTTIIQAYFHHQRLPGFRYVKRNQYQLIQGKDRRTIIPAQWDYTVISDGTVEMSILVNSFGSGGSCPRCHIVAQKWHENEWITCESCQKQFKPIHNQRITKKSIPPLSLKPASNNSSRTSSESTQEQLLGENREEGELTKESDEEIKKIRLILAIYKGTGNESTQSDPLNTTVFVAGLSRLISEDMLRTFFAPFGAILYVKVIPGKSCGFVQFVRKSDAERAIEALSGFSLGGSRVRLSWGRTTATNAPPPKLHTVNINSYTVRDAHATQREARPRAHPQSGYVVPAAQEPSVLSSTYSAISSGGSDATRGSYQSPRLSPLIHNDTPTGLSQTTSGASPRQFVPVTSFGPPSPTHPARSSPEMDDLRP